ncbi:uncharacterized protein HKW66_Vig0011270 [Vigna angularis]|uniref:Uncharacterized protein n=1 Tax=Phaseolus angularis TaxID=3914 RepID=A0A8T0LFQ9_PHAAN|nr:uncharacterized protein HKW66_Vig0011270 [Vigna angularis]
MLRRNPKRPISEEAAKAYDTVATCPDDHSSTAGIPALKGTQMLIKQKPKFKNPNPKLQDLVAERVLHFAEELVSLPVPVLSHTPSPSPSPSR